MAALDTFFSRYGWDYWQYLEQPEWLIQELVALFTAEGEYREWQQKKQQSKPEPPATHEALMQQARANGFLQAEPPER